MVGKDLASNFGGIMIGRVNLAILAITLPMGGGFRIERRQQASTKLQVGTNHFLKVCERRDFQREISEH